MSQKALLAISAGLVAAVLNHQSGVKAAVEQHKQGHGGVQMDSGAFAATSTGLLQDTLTHFPQTEGMASLREVVGYLGDEAGIVVDRIAASIDQYKKRFGVLPADSALHSGFEKARAILKGDSPNQKIRAIRSGMAQLDSASNYHQDGLSLRAGITLASVLSTLSSANPFSGIIPFNMGSNEAKFVLITPRAGNDYGAYRENQIIVGKDSGEPFALAGRLQVPTGTANGANTDYVTSFHECVTPVAGGYVGDATSPAVRILAGRTLIIVDGMEVATDMRSTNQSTNVQNSGTTTINSSFNLRGSAQQYTITGTCNVDTGAVAFTISPSLPVSVDNPHTVRVMGYIDWERNSSRTNKKERRGSIIHDTAEFTIYAEEATLQSSVSLGAEMQANQELGISFASLSLGANDIVQAERVKRVLTLGSLVADHSGFSRTLPLDMSTSLNAKTVGEAITDAIAMTIEEIEAQMVADTWMATPAFVYVPALLVPYVRRMQGFQNYDLGIKAGIYYIGSMNGKSFYCVPNMKSIFGEYDPDGSEAIMLISGGDSTDPARAPIIMGDAIPFMPVDSTGKYDADF